MSYAMTDADLIDPPEDAVARATRELGAPEALFAVSPKWVRAKLAVGLGLVAYGLIANYLWFAHGPGRVGHVQVELLILPPIIGAGLLVFLYRNRGLRVMVYPTGLLRLRPGEAESVPWAEVREVVLKGEPDGPPVLRWGSDGKPTDGWIPLKVPVAQTWTTAVQVTRTDGVEVVFRPALADYPALVERVQRGTFAALWPAALQTLAGGREVRFGDLAVSARELKFGDKSLPWADVAEVAVTGRTVAVKRHGGWLPWFAKELSAVPNPHLLLAVAEVLMPAKKG